MQALKKNYQRIISLRLAKRIIISLVVVLCFDFFLFPVPVLASDFSQETDLSQDITITVNPDQLPPDEQTGIDQPIIINQLPDNPNLLVKWSSFHVVTAYNSELGQTDNSPCITATGFDLCQHGQEDTIAANFLPFGAKIRIPEIFGDKVFIVRDRMNQRHANRLDIWMLNKQAAKEFGVKLAKVEILE